MRSTKETPSTRPLRTGATTADDGTELGWMTVGDGPGLVIVHGSMQSAGSQRDLAELLADRFTVHLVDRRGRGRSGPYPHPSPAAHSRTDREVHDLSAVLSATGATAVLGISSGAIITLRTALMGSAHKNSALPSPALTKIALFEPPLSVGGSIRLELIERCRQEFAVGDLTGAMVSGMIVAEMGPAAIRRLPRPVLRAMTGRMITRDDARELPPETPHLRQLAAALETDLDIVAENADSVSHYRELRVATLLLSGTRSPRYLQTAVSTLAGVIPGATRVELNGTNHGATQNRDAFGTPERVVPALVDFLAPASAD